MDDETSEEVDDNDDDDNSDETFEEITAKKEVTYDENTDEAIQIPSSKCKDTHGPDKRKFDPILEAEESEKKMNNSTHTFMGAKSRMNITGKIDNRSMLVLEEDAGGKSANDNYFANEIPHSDYYHNQYSDPVSISALQPISINTNYTCSLDMQKSPR